MCATIPLGMPQALIERTIRERRGFVAAEMSRLGGEAELEKEYELPIDTINDWAGFKILQKVRSMLREQDRLEGQEKENHKNNLDRMRGNVNILDDIEHADWTRRRSDKRIAMGASN